MDTVGIIPEDPEILGRRLQTRETANRLVRIGIALGIGVLRYTPDTLDGLVLRYQPLNHIHIRAGGRHGNRDHFDSKILGDGKMPVIPRNRAQEFHLVQLAPGSIAQDTVGHGSGNRIIHHIQRRIAVNDDVVRVILHHVADQYLCLVDTRQHTVVTAVGSVLAAEVHPGIQRIHHSHGQIQLLPTWFPAAHVQSQILLLELVILRPKIRQLHLQFVLRHFSIWFHLYAPPDFYAVFFGFRRPPTASCL